MRQPSDYQTSRPATPPRLQDFTEDTAVILWLQCCTLKMCGIGIRLHGDGGGLYFRLAFERDLTLVPPPQ
eukprot:5065858-Amphidinium_carterae.1